MAGENTGRYTRRRDGWTTVEWAAPLIACLVGLLNLYAGAVTGNGAFGVIGASFFAGVALYFTVYWQPVLYLLVAVYVLALGGFWVLSGVPLLSLGILNGVVSLCLVALCLALYVRDATADGGA